MDKFKAVEDIGSSWVIVDDNGVRESDFTEKQTKAMVFALNALEEGDGILGKLWDGYENSWEKFRYE